MSFNNYVDAEAAGELVNDFETTAVAIIKHTNPAGVGQANTASEAYQKALATDPVSAFGGIVAFNCLVDEQAAQEVIKIFTEVVIAPEFDPSALEILKSKKNLRVLRITRDENAAGLEYRQISGGMLIQNTDTHQMTRDMLRVGDKQIAFRRRSSGVVICLDSLQTYKVERHCLRSVRSNCRCRCWSDVSELIQSSWAR